METVLPSQYINHTLTPQARPWPLWRFGIPQNPMAQNRCRRFSPPTCIQRCATGLIVSSDLGHAWSRLPAFHSRRRIQPSAWSVLRTREICEADFCRFKYHVREQISRNSHEYKLKFILRVWIHPLDFDPSAFQSGGYTPYEGVVNPCRIYGPGVNVQRDPNLPR